MADRDLRDAERCWFNDPNAADAYDVAYCRVGHPGLSPPRHQAVEHLLIVLWTKVTACRECGEGGAVFPGRACPLTGEIPLNHICYACGLIIVTQLIDGEVEFTVGAADD